MLPTVSGEFRVVADPELRFSPSGMAVGSLRVAANSRKLNKDTNEWEDDKACFLNVVVFKQVAENVVESIQKGDLINVVGRLETRTYETREGEKRLSVDVVADQIGPSVKYATAKITKAQRNQGTGGNQQSNQGAGNNGGQAEQQVQDPWAAGQSDDPPF